MNNISYFKLQAKNLFHDIKLDFMQEDENYVCSPRFFDANAVVSTFNIDTDNFSLMKAQHIIAKIVGMDSWKELISAPDAILGQKKLTLDASDFKIKHQKVNYINLSQYERIAEGQRGDYLVKCPRLPELEEIIKRKPDSYCLSACPENKDDFDIQKFIDDFDKKNTTPVTLHTKSA